MFFQNLKFLTVKIKFIEKKAILKLISLFSNVYSLFLKVNQIS